MGSNPKYWRGQPRRAQEDNDMKKLLAMLLATLLVLSMGLALADGGTPTEPVNTDAPTYEDAETATFKKTYKLEGKGTSPAETFSFENIEFTGATETGAEYTEAWAKANLPTISTVTYAAGAATADGAEKEFTITLPVYPSVGIYTYTFNEVDNNIAGVTYDTTEMTLVVSVVEADGLKRIAAVHCESPAIASYTEGNKKTDKFENTYSANNLSVKKTVTGNLGDKSKEFPIKVTLTATAGDTVNETISYNDGEAHTIAITDWTVANTGNTWTGIIYVKDGETVTFTNVPAGTTYEVVELDDDEETEMATGGKTTDGYTVTYDESIDGEISAEAASSTEIINNKEIEVDTGVNLSTLPYILIVALVVVGAVIMMIRRRKASED